jgi:hypothetical protein
VATFDGPFVRSDDDLFADPFDAPPSTLLRLLLMHDAVDAEDFETSRVAAVVAATAREGGVLVTELRAEPGPALARIASLVGLTDFASVYLALGLGLDPATSPHVADLKERMR